MSNASKSRALLFALALLCGCGDGRQDAAQQDPAEAALPKPEQSAGSITGMPAKPGPGGVPLAGEPPPPEVAVDVDDLFNPEAGFLPGGGDEASPGEPTVEDAVAVIRDYYASIDAGSHDRAYALWSDGGRASGQTPQQFADGFARTARVVVEIGEPGRVDPGAGQRYIRVPVSVTATQDDGSVRRYVGDYVLHRTVVDGATAEQRAWRIASADLREVRR